MHLDKFDLNLLVAIEALMRRRSVTAAAEELRITQSALSSALKRARLHFGDELLFYDGQSMVPTSFGRELEDLVPDMIAQLRAIARMRADSDLKNINREFSIIASDYVAAVYISELSRKLSGAAPGISIRVAPFVEDTISQFKRGVIDFLIGPAFSLEEGMNSQLLFEDTFQCVLWRENPLLPDGFTPDAYLSSPLVLTELFLADGKSHFEHWLAQQTATPTVAASLPSFLLLPHYIAGTQNIATIHKRLVPHFASHEELVFVDPPIPVPPLQEFLVTTRKHLHDSEAKLLQHKMLEVGRELAKSQ